jgi:hypothetical protein
MDIWIGFPIWNNHSIDYEIFWNYEFYGNMIYGNSGSIHMYDSKIIYGGYGNIYKLVWSDGDVFQENDLWID